MSSIPLIKMESRNTKNILFDEIFSTTKIGFSLSFCDFLCGYWMALLVSEQDELGKAGHISFCTHTGYLIFTPTSETCTDKGAYSYKMRLLCWPHGFLS